MEKVSVIVPVYNVEKYLNKCLDSIINQTYKNIEIILVDDGSTDNSGIICDKYSQTDNRIKVIHKKNGGLSDARNTGIKNATGKILSFIDSDDYIEKNMIENLAKELISYDCDIVFSNKIFELDNGKKVYKEYINNSGVVDSATAMKLLLKSDPAVCDKLFKKELFNDIKFPINKLYEDILVTPYIIEKCNRIYLDKNFYYHYIQHDNSIVHKKFTTNKMDYVYNAKKVYSMIINRYKSLEEEAIAYYILVLATVITEIYPLRKKFNQEYNYTLNELQSLKKKYACNSCLPFSKKIMLWFDYHKMIWFSNLIKMIRASLLYK